MQPPEFLEHYKKLNPQQREAVDTIEGPVMVVAGPGTGKTQILTLRIANILLNSQINPENILALTFSDSAARQMRSRLSEIIGTGAYRVDITTFHSFGSYIIQNFPEEFDHLLSSNSITEVEQIELIEKILNDNNFDLIKPFGEPLFYVSKLLSAINDLKKEGVTPEKFEAAIEESFNDWGNISDLHHDKGRYKGEMKGVYSQLKRELEKNKELLFVYKMYQEKLKSQRKYDFSDMLIEVIKVLESNKRLLLLLQEKYQYFLVDEHQDTNAAQNRLVELLASFHKNPNLFVVGDEKQAIFRFQGASLENFFYFKKLYPSAKLITLTQNYRSQQLILDAAHSLIEKNISANIMFKTVVKLKSLKEKPISKIKLFEAKTFFEEFSGIAKDIKTKIDAGEMPSEIAVLGRNNRDLEEIQATLDKYKIPSSLVSDTDLLTSPAVQKIILFLKLVNNPLDETNLIRAMHVRSLNIDPFDIYKLLDYSRKNKTSFLNQLKKLKKKEIKNLDIESFKQIKDFVEALTDWQKINHNEDLEKLFISIFDDSGLKNQILEQSDYETFSKVSNFFEIIKEKAYKTPEYSLKDFLRFLEITMAHNLPIRSKLQIFESDTVKLMTAHKSKGQEFNYVYIIGAFDGHWGNKRKIGASFKLPWDKLGIKVTLSDDENEDERRLFYVAMTRARKEVFLSYSKLSLEGKDQLPSQFIQEIKPELIEKIEIKPDKKTEELVLSKATPLKVETKNAEIIKSIFSRKGLSITALQNFLECPWKWFFRSLLSLPDTKTSNMIFGSAVHLSLNNYLKAVQVGPVDRKLLITFFSQSLDREFLTEIERERLLKQGEKALNSFYEQIAKNWKKGLIGEAAIKGVKLHGLSLSGRIDLIEPVGKGGAIIHDFKTGRPKSRRQIDGSSPESKYNYLRQLTFYKLLLDKYKDGQWKADVGVIDFVEPDEKGRIKSEMFEIRNNNIDELVEEIRVVGDQILSLNFWDISCGEKDCQWCKLRRLVD